MIATWDEVEAIIGRKYLKEAYNSTFGQIRQGVFLKRLIYRIY